MTEFITKLKTEGSCLSSPFRGRRGVYMLSRVADSLYWMSRYMERSDNILRMLKINYAASQDDVQEFSWLPILKIFTFLKKRKQKRSNTIPGKC